VVIYGGTIKRTTYLLVSLKPSVHNLRYFSGLLVFESIINTEISGPLLIWFIKYITILKIVND
jgi:hypothetical protein